MSIGLAVASLIGLVGCANRKTAPFSCSLARNEAVYGLSGEWIWPDGYRPRRICLRQISPVRVLGLTEVDGKVAPLVGAVAPSGAIFVMASPADSSSLSFVAHRQNDSIILDWLAEQGMPDKYAAGILAKRKYK